MQIHSSEKIQELKELRMKGYSINELVKRLSIPKTTVWHHVHNVKVPPKYVFILKAKRGGSKQRSQRNWEEAKGRALILLNNSGHRDLVIALAMLYWGEGNKKACEFINSDGRMIKFYLFVLRKIFCVDENAIKATMRIFSGMDERECLNYWSGITGIPCAKFIIRFNDGGTSGKTRYGMCRITVRKGSKILKLIHSLRDEFLKYHID
ncbi:MAG: hypothetical protein HY764_02300 [Candidatus Portnoybacteria bacterium]|nr:hypothetical protein [Candidatus Portnoybacteria bacterium]